MNNNNNHMYPPHSQGPSMPHDAPQQQQQQHAALPLPPQGHQGLPAVNHPPYPMQGHHLPAMTAYDPYSGGSAHALAEQGQTPTTPAEDSKPSIEDLQRSQKALKPYSGTVGEWKFTLEFVQQPKRARMCGFGDKDRRPITPPPCVRLIVTDIHTGKEVDCNEIDHSKFVLNVDLWSDDALKEVNLVRHTTSTPSISSTTPASFAQMEQTPAHMAIMPGGPHPGFSGPGGFPGVNPYSAGSAYSQGPYGNPNGYAPQVYMPGTPFRPFDIPPVGAHANMPFAPPPMFGGRDEMGMPSRMPLSGNQPQGMFTRNLIGSLAASAFRLTDPTDKIGIWFILHDLSVRTEGDFRLRASFVDLSDLSRIAANNVGNNPVSINRSAAPIAASCFSDAFTVYSAKKFPGVCESTALSKCFASQGIKIPIRKDGAGGKGGDDDDFE